VAPTLAFWRSVPYGRPDAASSHSVYFLLRDFDIDQLDVRTHCAMHPKLQEGACEPLLGRRHAAIVRGRGPAAVYVPPFAGSAVPRHTLRAAHIQRRHTALRPGPATSTRSNQPLLRLSHAAPLHNKERWCDPCRVTHLMQLVALAAQHPAQRWVVPHLLPEQLLDGLAPARRLADPWRDVRAVWAQHLCALGEAVAVQELEELCGCPDLQVPVDSERLQARRRRLPCWLGPLAGSGVR